MTIFIGPQLEQVNARTQLWEGATYTRSVLWLLIQQELPSWFSVCVEGSVLPGSKLKEGALGWEGDPALGHIFRFPAPGICTIQSRQDENLPHTILHSDLHQNGL